MRRKHNFIALFFIAGCVPTAKEKAEFDKLPAKRKSFRNVQFVSDSMSPEDCDAVEGIVPEIYKKFPTCAQFIEKVEQAEASLEAETSDAVAPVEPPKVEGVVPETGKPKWGAS